MGLKDCQQISSIGTLFLPLCLPTAECVSALHFLLHCNFPKELPLQQKTCPGNFQRRSVWSQSGLKFPFALLQAKLLKERCVRAERVSSETDCTQMNFMRQRIRNCDPTTPSKRCASLTQEKHFRTNISDLFGRSSCWVLLTGVALALTLGVGSEFDFPLWFWWPQNVFSLKYHEKVQSTVFYMTLKTKLKSFWHISLQTQRAVVMIWKSLLPCQECGQWLDNKGKYKNSSFLDQRPDFFSCTYVGESISPRLKIKCELDYISLKRRTRRLAWMQICAD